MQGWLSSVHGALRDQLAAERCELLATSVLLYEHAGVACSSHRCGRAHGVV